VPRKMSLSGEKNKKKKNSAAVAGVTNRCSRNFNLLKRQNETYIRRVVTIAAELPGIFIVNFLFHS